MSELPGRRYRLRVIRAGLSKNGNYYPDDALRAAVPLFDGARVFVKGDREHLAGAGKDVRNLIGRLAKPEFVPGQGRDRGEIQADLELIDPEGEIGRKLSLAWNKGMTDLFGFSIDGAGRSRTVSINGATVRRMEEMTELRSVDLIVEPGAGGRVLDLIESARPEETGKTEMNLRESIVNLIRTRVPKLLDDVPSDAPTDDEIMSLLLKAIPIAAGSETGPTVDTRESADRTTRLRSRLDRTRLPERSKERLLAEIGLSDYTEAEIERKIVGEINACARLGGGNIVGLGGEARIEFLEGRREKVDKMLDAFFDPKDRSVNSIRECYLEITGDRAFTGMVRECDRTRLREALGSDDLANVLGDAITRRMIKEYNVADSYDAWRDLADVVPVTDFRTQERTRWGGYGNLPVVAERGAYTELASPGDEKASYEVSKRGGIESVSLEMVTNDDVGVVRDIPKKLALAAKRTLSEFVFTFPASNAVIYDGKALFCAEHGNIGAAASSSGGIAAARLAIKAQRERDSDKKLSLPASFLWVPDELEETAFNLFKRDTNNDADFVQSLALQVRPVWCWDNAKNWMLSASVRDIRCVEIGFLGGKEDPELFVQDNPTSGSLFSNDVITYKVRHIYGGAVIDYRGLYKSVVP